jgi:multiple sugar transport system substrate-binding protein
MPEESTNSSSSRIDRRTFLTSAGVTGSAALVAGCTTGGNETETTDAGGDGTTTGDSDGSLSGTTITHLQYSSAQSKANKAVKEQFEEETGITVEIEAAPFDDLLSKTLTSLRDESATYDVIDADMSLLPEFAATGGLQPLDDRVDESSVVSPDLFPEKIWKDAAVYGPPDNYNPLTADETRINQIPYQTNVLQGYHRTDLYNEAGLEAPTSITEYITAGKELTDEDAGIWGMAMMAAQHDSIIDEWKSEYYATGNGFFEDEVVDPKADIQGFSPTWEPTFNNDQAVKSLEHYVERANADYTPPGVASWNWTHVTRNFTQGKLATAQAFSSTAQVANDPEQSQIAGDVGYHLYPGISTDYPGVESESDLPHGPVSRAPHYGSWCLAIPKGSEKKEAAWKWIEFLNQKDVIMERAKLGAQPSQTRAFEELMKEENEVFPGSSAFYESLYTNIVEWGVGRPKLIGYFEWRNMMVKWLNRAVTGQVTASEALSNAESETKEILSNTMEGYGNY